jgi:hypothetical protein
MTSLVEYCSYVTSADAAAILSNTLATSHTYRLAVVGPERIERLFDPLQPLKKFSPELLIHSVGIRSIAGQCVSRLSDVCL